METASRSASPEPESEPLEGSGILHMPEYAEDGSDIETPGQSLPTISPTPKNADISDVSDKGSESFEPGEATMEIMTEVTTDTSEDPHIKRSPPSPTGFVDIVGDRSEEGSRETERSAFANEGQSEKNAELRHGGAEPILGPGSEASTKNSDQFLRPPEAEILKTPPPIPGNGKTAAENDVPMLHKETLETAIDNSPPASCGTNVANADGTDAENESSKAVTTKTQEAEDSSQKEGMDLPIKLLALKNVVAWIAERYLPLTGENQNELRVQLEKAGAKNYGGSENADAVETPSNAGNIPLLLVIRTPVHHLHRHVTVPLSTSLQDLKQAAWHAFFLSSSQDAVFAFGDDASVQKLDVWWNHPASGWTAFPDMTEVTEQNTKDVLLWMKEKGNYDFVEVVLEGEAREWGERRDVDRSVNRANDKWHDGGWGKKEDYQEGETTEEANSGGSAAGNLSDNTRFSTQWGQQS